MRLVFLVLVTNYVILACATLHPLSGASMKAEDHASYCQIFEMLPVDCRHTVINDLIKTYSPATSKSDVVDTKASVERLLFRLINGHMSTHQLQTYLKSSYLSLDHLKWLSEKVLSTTDFSSSFSSTVLLEKQLLVADALDSLKGLNQGVESVLKCHETDPFFDDLKCDETEPFFNDQSLIDISNPENLDFIPCIEKENDITNPFGYYASLSDEKEDKKNLSSPVPSSQPKASDLVSPCESSSSKKRKAHAIKDDCRESVEKKAKILEPSSDDIINLIEGKPTGLLSCKLRAELAASLTIKEADPAATIVQVILLCTQKVFMSSQEDLVRKLHFLHDYLDSIYVKYDKNLLMQAMTNLRWSEREWIPLVLIVCREASDFTMFMLNTHYRTSKQIILDLTIRLLNSLCSKNGRKKRSVDPGRFLMHLENDVLRLAAFTQSFPKNPSNLMHHVPLGFCYDEFVGSQVTPTNVNVKMLLAVDKLTKLVKMNRCAEVTNDLLAQASPLSAMQFLQKVSDHFSRRNLTGKLPANHLSYMAHFMGDRSLIYLCQDQLRRQQTSSAAVYAEFKKPKKINFSSVGCKVTPLKNNFTRLDLLYAFLHDAKMDLTCNTIEERFEMDHGIPLFQDEQEKSQLSKVLTF